MVSRGFTGQEEMDPYCLVNLNARIYDPTLGRMTSEDPVVADPTSAQSFNGYSYVANSPLVLIDPTGYCPVLECITVTHEHYDGGSDGDYAGYGMEPGPGGGGSGNDGGGNGTKSPQAPNPKNGQCTSSVVSAANQTFNGAGKVSTATGYGAAALFAASAGAAAFGQLEVAVPLAAWAETLNGVSLGGQVVQVIAGAVNAQQTGNWGQFDSSITGLGAGVVAGTVPNAGPLAGATGSAVQQAMGSNNTQPSCH